MGIYSILEILLSDFALGDAPVGYPTPWSELQYVAGSLVIVIVYELITPGGIQNSTNGIG